MTHRLDEDLRRDLWEAVREAESRMAVELVVVLARASGSYRDADLLCGITAALAALAVVLYCPWDVHPHLVLPIELATLVAGATLSSRSSPLRRLLTTERRRRAQARAGARLAFTTHEVASTRERTGLLIYYSDLERALEILPDVAIAGRLSRSVFNEIQRRFEDEVTSRPLAELMRRVVADMAGSLGPVFPAREEEPDELPDLPRVEP